MLHKKAPGLSSPDGVYRKELDYLYARKSAIDALIESLEAYFRFRPMDLQTPASIRLG
jgi:hypothetical protein